MSQNVKKFGVSTRTHVTTYTVWPQLVTYGYSLLYLWLQLVTYGYNLLPGQNNAGEIYNFRLNRDQFNKYNFKTSGWELNSRDLRFKFLVIGKFHVTHNEFFRIIPCIDNLFLIRYKRFRYSFSCQHRLFSYGAV